MVPIRTFAYEDKSFSSNPNLRLALSRRGASYLLVYPSSAQSSSKERQHTVINALASEDPFPELGDEGRIRIWLKVGPGKAGSEGGENAGMLESLVAAGIVQDLKQSSQQGLITYPLVEVLVPEREFCNVCASCGNFESIGEEGAPTIRYKRCARCRLAYYCSSECQVADWKKSHRSTCFDLPDDDDASVEAARRHQLLLLFGRDVASSAVRKSKFD